MCDGGVNAQVWLRAEFVRPCNRVEWAQKQLNEGELRVTQNERVPLKDDPDKGPHKISLYFRNPTFKQTPVALRGPVNPTWNPGLQKVMVVI